MHTTNFKSFKTLGPYLTSDGENIWDFNHLNLNGEKLVGKLKSCNNRNGAEKLKGKKIFTEKKNFPKLDSQQYYVNDLIDCKVQNLNNKLLGTIFDINNFGAGDLINIKNSNGKSFYVPMNKENVVKVDIKNKLVVISPIKGMID